MRGGGGLCLHGRPQRRLTPSLIMGLTDTNVTELRIYEIDETISMIDFAKYIPYLKSLEINTRRRHLVDVFNTFRHLKLLENLRIVNVDVDFSRMIPPWIHSIKQIHIENSTLRELPIWLAMSNKLHTLTVKRLRSAKLSGNSMRDLGKHVFLSKDIYDIDLSRNMITTFAAHTFALCTELRVLDLSHNPLESLPYKPFFRNSKLKWIKLSGTKISKLEPGHFVGLTSLKSLTLSYSPLRSIHPFAFLPLKSLKSLDLEATNITTIPSAIIQNCGLTLLNVAHNMLHGQSSLQPEVVAMLSGLSQLKMDGN
ncbi:leucine Rich repeat-containing domain protein, partial [Necator americanus]